MPVLECSRCNELYYSAHGSTELSCDACGGNVWRVFEDEVSFARVAGLPRRLQPGDHAVLLYSEDGEAADFCAGYVREHLSHGGRLIVALPDGFRDKLMSRLTGDEADKLVVLDAGRLYGRDFDPETTVREYAEIASTAGESLGLLSGPDGQAAAEIDLEQWLRYERLAHELVVELEVTALCVYDGRRLPIGFSPVAGEAHPMICRGGAELRRNPEFRYQAPGA